jgi:hypothetical protein
MDYQRRTTSVAPLIYQLTGAFLLITVLILKPIFKFCVAPPNEIYTKLQLQLPAGHVTAQCTPLSK